MEARHRERTLSLPFGRVTYPGQSGPQVGGPWVIATIDQVCDDFWKKKYRRYDLTGVGLPPSNFDLVSFYRKWTPITTTKSTSSFALHGVPPSAISNSISDLSPPAGQALTDSQYAIMLLARTNPMRPVFSVPVAIKELVDLFSLFAGISVKTFRSYVGSSYLTYRFGWTQFVSDVRTLAKLVDSINSRVKEYNSLIKTGGLRRKVKLDTWSNSSSGLNAIIHSSYGHTVYSNYRTSTKCTIWGSVRWYPTTINAIPTDAADRWLLAVRQCLDLEVIDFETAWNLIPWTWLIDYFFNIGDYLAAYEGRSVVVPRDVCIMRRFDTLQVGSRSDRTSPNYTGGDYRKHRVTLRRRVVTPPSTPTALGQLLSWNQWKVVLALLAKFR